MTIRDRLRLVATMTGLGAVNVHLRSLRSARQESLWNEWNDAHKALFIHVPKTGGNTVRRALGMPTPSRWHRSAWATLQMDRTRFGESYTFAFLRDPLERFLSAYSHSKRPNVLGGNALLSAYPHLHDWDRFTWSFERSRRCRAMILSSSHFCPQHYYVCAPGGKVLMDRLYRTEMLDEALDTLGAKLGITPEHCYWNQSTRDTDGHVIPPRMKAILRRYFARDYALLEYCAGQS